jgi:hypothetical protein
MSLALLLGANAHAERLGKGRSFVFVGIGGHRGEFAAVLPPLAGFPGSIGRLESSEVGGEIAYNRFLSDQWTLAVSGGYHASRVRTEYVDFTGTSDTHSFTVRIGADRFAFIDDQVALYAGPGVFLARGRWKSNVADITTTGPDASEVGLSGRIGMYARIGKG